MTALRGKTRGPGAIEYIRCAHCEWSGRRARSTTQPCPNCSKPLDWSVVLERRVGINERSIAKRKREGMAVAEVLAASIEAERQRRAAEDEAITALLRQAREAVNG